MPKHLQKAKALVGVSFCAAMLVSCASTNPAPVVQGGIKQNWLGQDGAASRTAAAPAAVPMASRVIAQNTTPIAAYQQPVAPLLQEEDLPSLAPAAGPIVQRTAPVQTPTQTVAPAVVARPSAFAVQPTAQPAPEVTTYTIQQTDTLYRIARNHNTTPNAIMQANGLSDITDLAPGRTLTIPANTKVSAPSLAESILSYLETPANTGLQVAPQLAMQAAIPPQTAATQTAAAQSVYDVARIEPAAGRKDGMNVAPEAKTHKHPVAAGETIYRISKTYGVSVLDIMAANDLAKPEALQAGMVLNIPATASAEVVATERASAESSQVAPETRTASLTPTGSSLRPAADLGVTDATRATIAAQRAAQVEASATRSFDPDKGTDSAASVRPLKEVKPAQDADRLKAELKRGTIDRAAASQSGMVWPAQGEVVKRFGEKGQGVAYTGINIAVPVGTPVLASEAGTVLYADSGLRMYGQMVLVRHTNGMVAAYAHNSHLLVRKGEKVKKGQVIAMSGQSGNAASPQLHFELRRNAVALDPLKVLPQM